MIRSLPLLIILPLILACVDTDTPQSTQLTEPLQGTVWQIVYFEDEGVDESDEFENWQLEFTTSGTVHVFFDEDLKATGTWRSVRDDGKDEIRISSLPDIGELGELNEDWYLIEQTETLLKLEDRGENYITKLHLRKN